MSLKTLSEFKTTFDPELSEFLARELLRIKTQTDNAFIHHILEQSRHIITNGGKRLRPYLTWLMYQSAGVTETRSITPYLIGLELFHGFCLIHDDVIDHGQERHGTDTINRFAANLLTQDQRQGNLAHSANAQAILVGDLIYSLTMKTFYAATNDPLADQALKLVESMIEEVIIGQMIDVDLTTHTDTPLNLIEQKMDLKTARYSFIHPMRLGVSLADPTDHQRLAFCQEFGRALGLAFQIQDDLLDIITPAKQGTKTLLSDLAERQQTLFTYAIFQSGTSKQQNLLVDFWSGQTQATPKTIQQLFTPEILNYGKEHMDRYFAQARKLLEDSPLGPDYKESLRQLVSLIQERAHA